jgi:glycosyltransferase involved in cell wall biosynthesis
VNQFLANSAFVARRIHKVYGRDAHVIHPPVDTESFALRSKKDNFYLTISRMVPYKRVSLIVEAFAKMPDKQLIVIGDGPEAAKIKELATPNVRLLGYLPPHDVVDYMQRARAFVFAAEEDFGIVPVEAQACGTPVIAFGRGGATETVIPGVTGVLFAEQTVASIRAAVLEAESREFDPRIIRRHAERFSAARFRQEFGDFIDEQWKLFHDGCTPSIQLQPPSVFQPAAA